MWVKLSDEAPHHPKVLEAGPVASWLWICGLTYCARYLTDGFIPAAALPTLLNVPMPQEHAGRLVAVGLWHAVDGGYQVHDFLEYNPTAATVKARREADLARKQGRSLHKESERNPAGSGADSAKNPERSRARDPVPSRPVLKECTDAVASAAHASVNERFEEFWKAYPRKVGRLAALTEWRKLKPSEELTAAIVSAVHHQCTSSEWKRENGRYVPNPRTWLHQGRWQDELPSQRADNAADRDDNRRTIRRSPEDEDRQREYERQIEAAVAEMPADVRAWLRDQVRNETVRMSLLPDALERVIEAEPARAIRDRSRGRPPAIALTELIALCRGDGRRSPVVARAS